MSALVDTLADPPLPRWKTWPIAVPKTKRATVACLTPIAHHHRRGIVVDAGEAGPCRGARLGRPAISLNHSHGACGPRCQDPSGEAHPQQVALRHGKGGGFPAGFRYAERAQLAHRVHRKRAGARPPGQHLFHTIGLRLENASRSPHNPLDPLAASSIHSDQSIEFRVHFLGDLVCNEYGCDSELLPLQVRIDPLGRSGAGVACDP